MLLRFSLVLILASLAFSQDTTDTTPQSLYGGLVLPQVRHGSSFNTSSDSICGGDNNRDQVHYMTTQGMDTEFRWYIETPTPDSVCLIRITDKVDFTDETGYVNLIPLGRDDVGADGYFPCGRTSGVDSAFVDIPDQIDGDACVLEWIWKGANFTIRQCADISVVGVADNKCYGLCQNGGICQNGECVCPSGYSGTYCEVAGGVVGRAAKKVLSTVFFLILISLVVFLLILLCFWCAQRKIKKGEETQVYNTNRKYFEFDQERSTQPSGQDKPADRIKPDTNDIQNE